MELEAADQPPRRRVGRPPTLDRTAALEAAQRVIARRGVDRTRYADVATEAGVPVSTLQHAFGTLDALVRGAVVAATAGELDILLDESQAGDGTSWEQLQRLLSSSIAAPEDSEESAQSWLIWGELWRLAAREPEMSTHVSGIYDSWHTHLTALVREGAQAGEFTSPLATEDPDAAARAIMALIDGAGIAYCLRADRWEPDQAETLLRHSLTSMLGVRPLR